MKNTALIFSIVLSSSMSFAAPSKATLQACRTSAVKLANAVINSKEMTSEGSAVTLADANEKSVQVIATDKETGAPTYRITYSAVNREVGFNMEGEWSFVADVKTELGEGDASNEGCGVASTKIQIKMPKEIVR